MSIFSLKIGQNKSQTRVQIFWSLGNFVKWYHFLFVKDYKIHTQNQWAWNELLWNQFKFEGLFYTGYISTVSYKQNLKIEKEIFKYTSQNSHKYLKIKKQIKQTAFVFLKYKSPATFIRDLVWM